MAQVYYKLYKINSLGIRFFTVYGPYGRPDMFYYKASNYILCKEILKFIISKNRERFTYIDDVISALQKLENFIKIKNITKYTM